MDQDTQYQDEVLKCQDCGNDFTYTAKEQSFFHEMVAKKKFDKYSKPRRCIKCRRLRKSASYGDPIK